MATDTLQNETAPATPGNRRAWDKALAEFRHEEALSEARWAEHSKAEEAWEAACPRVARYFDKYKLGIGMNRENVEYWLRSYVTRTGDKIDVAATADEFMAYQQRNRDSKEAHQVEECFQRATSRDNGYFAARETLMATRLPTMRPCW